MSSLREIRLGLAENLSTLKTTYRDMQISPYVLPNPTAPVIWIKPAQGGVTEYHMAMRNGLEKWSVAVQAFVSTGVEPNGQMVLDELLDTDGDHSVKAAIEADLTLGGACNNLIVTQCTSYLEYQRPDGVQFYGAEWAVDIY